MTATGMRWALTWSAPSCESSSTRKIADDDQIGVLTAGLLKRLEVARQHQAQQPRTAQQVAVACLGRGGEYAQAHRIALIHATPQAVTPINQAFGRLWPEAMRMNLLDDSLSAEHARNGRLTDAMVRRFETLALYARDTGCTAILFTCSAFGPCIEAAAARRPHMPVLKPNEAMVADAAATPAHRLPPW